MNNYTYIKKAFSMGEPRDQTIIPYKNKLLDINVGTEEPYSVYVDPIKGIANAGLAAGAVLGAKHIPGNVAQSVLNPLDKKKKISKGYKKLFDKSTSHIPFIGRIPAKARTGLTAALAALGAGTYSALNTNPYTNTDNINTDLNSNIPSSLNENNSLKTLGYGTGGAATGAGLGYLINKLSGSDSNVLPLILSVLGGTAGAGYANKDEILNYFNK